MLLEDQHRSQPHRSLTRTTNINTHTLRLLQKLISSRTIKRNECSLSLASQILELAWVFLCQFLNLSIQIVASSCCVVYQVQTLDFLNNGSEEDSASWISHPGVELSVWLVWSQLWVAEIVTSSLCLLGECNHIRRSLKSPVIMCPEFASSSNSGLHLVDDHKDVVFLGQSTETTEEGRGGVVVASFGLDGFDNYGAGWEMVGCDEAFDVYQSFLFSFSVLLDIVLEWVFEKWEGSLWPIEGRDIEFVDWLRASSRQGAEETAVESGLEGED